MPVLAALELKDFALVDELRLELAPGLNALTGETGAGKSLLVDALSLLIGQRGDSSLIRQGSESSLVQGLFEGEEVASASRRLQHNGRPNARIDGELVTVAELAERVGKVLTVHGQHAALMLSARDEPRRRLDRLLDAAGRRTLAGYQEAYREYTAAAARLADLQAGVRERERRRDTLKFELEEIDSARLRAGEDDLLKARVEALRNAERIRHSVARALTAVSNGEFPAVELLDTAARELDNVTRFEARLLPLARELHEARAAVQATATEIESFLDEFEAGPDELEAVENRLARIGLLERKYGDGVAAILAYREQAAAELTRLENDELDLDQLQVQVAQFEGELRRLGAQLATARRQAADRLATETMELLARLGMSEARLRVGLAPLEEPGPHGLERPWFEFGANPGEGLADLAEVASGGELSRVMLALDLVTGADRPVLVFDEVDAGIGGEAARAVGSLLKKLSRDRQVLVVTHLPQVAAYADAQFFVSKVTESGRTFTRVRRLRSHERERELARMLSGTVTEASLQNARELVSDASTLAL